MNIYKICISQYVLTFTYYFCYRT